MNDIRNLTFHPLTPVNWKDLEKLFGPRGACGGCWCMSWRIKRSDFMKQRGEENRKAFKRSVDSGESLGIIAYADGEPVGWCSFGPREDFPRLEHSRVLKRLDEKPVLSVVCFYIAKAFRRKSASVALLRAVEGYALSKGVKILEGYPTDSKTGLMPDPFVHTGLVQAFVKAGFTEAMRRSRTRPIMRKTVMPKKEELEHTRSSSGQSN